MRRTGLRLLARQLSLIAVCLWPGMQPGYAIAASPEMAIATVQQFPLGLRHPMAQSAADAALVELGRYLFQSPALSADGSIACTSCHVPALGFSGNAPQAIGLAGFKAERRAPPLFNLYFGNSFMWDGRARTLEEQIPMPLQSAEMRIDWAAAITALDADPKAVALRAAGGLPHLTRKDAIRAISSFLTALVSGGSRFDRYYYGHDDDALSDAEKRGLRVFVRKARCVSCHLLDGSAAPLTDGGFHSIGIGFVDGGYNDHGRINVTGNPADDGLFKTPTLRNVALRPFLMHDGSMTSLAQVVRYYDRGGMKNAPNLDERLGAIGLTDQDVDDAVAFLNSLTADVVIYHPEEAATGQAELR